MSHSTRLIVILLAIGSLPPLMCGCAAFVRKQDAAHYFINVDNKSSELCLVQYMKPVFVYSHSFDRFTSCDPAEIESLTRTIANDQTPYVLRSIPHETHIEAMAALVAASESNFRFWLLSIDPIVLGRGVVERDKYHLTSQFVRDNPVGVAMGSSLNIWPVPMHAASSEHIDMLVVKQDDGTLNHIDLESAVTLDDAIQHRLWE